MRYFARLLSRELGPRGSRSVATQRGNSGTAIAGTVASAARLLLKGLLTGDLAGFPARSKRAAAAAHR